MVVVLAPVGCSLSPCGWCCVHPSFFGNVLLSPFCFAWWCRSSISEMKLNFTNITEFKNNNETKVKRSQVKQSGGRSCSCCVLPLSPSLLVGVLLPHPPCLVWCCSHPSFTPFLLWECAVFSLPEAAFPSSSFGVVPATFGWWCRFQMKCNSIT